MNQPENIPIKSIFVPERMRKEYGNIEQLADSILDKGTIQALVLAKRADGVIELVAGGRRLKALFSIDEDMVLTEGSVCDPQKPGFNFAHNLRPDQILEMELEENMQRLGMTWAEEILGIRTIHRAKEKVAHLNLEPWGMRQTGQLLGVSFGKVQSALVVADLLEKKEPSIMACTSFGECLKVLAKRQADEAAAILAKRGGMGTAADDALLNSLGLNDPTQPVQTQENTGSKTDQVPANAVKLVGENGAKLNIPLSKRFFLGDFRDVMVRMPDAWVNHIVSDIPFGIDMENLENLENIERVAQEHDVAQNVSMMKPFLEQSFRVLKDQGFCVFWYDLDHHEKLQGWAAEVGFKVQAWPIVWIKQHRCKNEAAGYNFTKTVEYAMVLRKGNAVLNKPQGVCHIEADGSIERKLYMNPFAKPFKIWDFIYSAIAIPGQSILDPFAGECSGLRAAILKGLTPYGIELNPQHYNAGIEQLKSAYKLLTENNVEFS